MHDDMIYHIFHATWMLGAEMAPYLWLGFAVAGFLHVFWPLSSITRHLGGSSKLAVLKASLIGIPLPLCSCGVLPVAMQLRKAGAGAAPTLSFLVTTPVTGVDSLMATWAFLGWFFTLIRLAVSLVLGLTIGLLAAFFLPEAAPLTAAASGTAPDSGGAVAACTDGCGDSCVTPVPAKESFLRRVGRMIHYGFWELPTSIAGSVATGLVLGGLITALLPAHLVADTVGAGFLGVVVSVAVAIPLYVCATGSIPIAAAMMLKGFSPGAALAFLVAGPATNAVGITTIYKLLGFRHLAIYLSVIFFGSLGFGWLFDQVLAFSGITFSFAAAGHGGHAMSPLKIAAGGVLFVVIAFSLARPLVEKLAARVRKPSKEDNMKDQVLCLSVPDMSCNHCKGTITKLINSEPGVTGVNVDLAHRTVEIVHEGAIAGADLLRKLEAAGYPSTVLEK